MLYKIDLIESLAAVAIGITLALSLSTSLTSTPKHAAVSQRNMQEAAQASEVSAHHLKPIKPHIPVEVLRVIDGDTVEVRAQIWLDQHITTKVRIRTIDAPELQSACSQERQLAEASRERLLVILGKNRAYLTDIGYDKYGSRILGNILTLQGQDIAGVMVSEGHARPYRGGRRQSWC
jgi:micrococcal nuclease